MYPIKLGLSSLTLESLAWSSLLLGARSDAVLSVFLISHAIACALFAPAIVTLLPSRYASERLPIMLLLFAASFSVPILGFVAVFGGIHLLHNLPDKDNGKAFSAVSLPEIDIHQRTAVTFPQTGMRAFLANTKAPVANRLRALVSLQNISGQIASPLLRDVLTDPSEDIRLLAYGMLDSREKILNEAIHQQSQHLRENTAGSEGHTAAARKLADLFWELVYQDLAQGDLRKHALAQSLAYTHVCLAQNSQDAALHLLHGRLLQSLGQPGEAQNAYNRALELGLPKTRVIPYLAEAAFDLGDISTVRSLMRDLNGWQSLPRLKPVICYWTPT